MALTERALQAVQAPLRMVQHATGQASSLEDELRPVRSDLDSIRDRLSTLEKKIDRILDDTDHIRTQQASEQAEGA